LAERVSTCEGPSRVGDSHSGDHQEPRAITGDTALRLGRYFGTTPEFWLNLQRDDELEQAAETFGERLEDEVKPRAA
jgi:antitoxin HigA-1